MKNYQLSRLPLDDEGRIDGFQFDGRNRRIALWLEKKEAKVFKQLCRRIYQSNYQRKYYRDNPHVREASKQRSIKQRRRAAVTRTCRNCPVMWTNVPGLQRGGRPPTKYCSKKCRTRWHNRELVKKRKEDGFWKKNWRRWDKRGNRKNPSVSAKTSLCIAIERRA